MKTFTRCTFATLLTLLTISNSHAEWKELGSNSLMVVYADLDTASNQGEKAQILSMLDFINPGVDPKTKKKVSSIIGLNEFNCPAISYRPIEYKEFEGPKGSGAMISDNKTPDSAFEAVENETWAAGVFNLVCQRK